MNSKVLMMSAGLAASLLLAQSAYALNCPSGSEVEVNALTGVDVCVTTQGPPIPAPPGYVNLDIPNVLKVFVSSKTD